MKRFYEYDYLIQTFLFHRKNFKNNNCNEENIFILGFEQ